MLELLIIYIFIAIVGAAFGSFFNVCISRIPRKKDVVLPSSHCPNCGAEIKFYHNIPVFSFLILKGRCYKCKLPIHWHYLAMELITPLLWALLFIKNGNTFDLFYLKFIIFVSFGLIIFFIDMLHKIIPDVLSLPLIILGIVFAFLDTGDITVAGSFIGGLGSFILFLLIGFLFYKRTSKEGLGGGDIKLIAAIGFFVGPVGALFTIFVSSILALTVMISINVDKNREFPFGPFIIFGSFLYLYCGDILLNSYLSLFQL